MSPKSKKNRGGSRNVARESARSEKRAVASRTQPSPARIARIRYELQAYLDAREVLQPDYARWVLRWFAATVERGECVDEKVMAYLAQSFWRFLDGENTPSALFRALGLGYEHRGRPGGISKSGKRRLTPERAEELGKAFLERLDRGEKPWLAAKEISKEFDVPNKTAYGLGTKARKRRDEAALAEFGDIPQRVLATILRQRRKRSVIQGAVDHVAKHSLLPPDRVFECLRLFKTTQQKKPIRPKSGVESSAEQLERCSEVANQVLGILLNQPSEPDRISAVLQLAESSGVSADEINSCLRKFLRRLPGDSQ